MKFLRAEAATLLASTPWALAVIGAASGWNDLIVFMLALGGYGLVLTLACVLEDVAAATKAEAE